MNSVLTIAGSDSSGGAGIQADIKTIMAHNLFAQSAITALTAQNTTGVFGVVDIDPDFVSQQIRVVFDDIRPDAVKIGMVSSAAIVDAIAQTLREVGARNIVVDPVMVATSGAKLISDDAITALVGELVPLADVVTPNMPEAALLAQCDISTHDDMAAAARAILAMGSANVLVKGGHDADTADDVLVSADGTEHWLRAAHVDTPNTHGTGCTLSSAIACGLANGLTVKDAVASAKAYITGALEHDLGLGRGSGPLNHAYRLFEI